MKPNAIVAILASLCLPGFIASADAIADKLAATYAAVTNIGAAIEEKGVSTNGYSLVDYADLIRLIGGGGGGEALKNGGFESCTTTTFENLAGAVGGSPWTGGTIPDLSANVSKKGAGYWTSGEQMNGDHCAGLQVKSGDAWLGQEATLSRGVYRASFIYQPRGRSLTSPVCDISLNRPGEKVTVGTVSIRDGDLHEFSSNVAVPADGKWMFRVDAYKGAITVDSTMLVDDFSLAYVGPIAPGVLTTNAMADASCGYEIYGLGVDGYEVASVFTNTAVAMTWTVPSGVTSADYLVIGGGGGGGAGIGGGGGAGGVLSGSLSTLDPSYTISVGAGGAGGVSVSSRIYYARGTNGVQSALGDIVAFGGGGGASYKEAGSDGGSGGGGASDVPRAGYGRGTSGQGYDGGYATVADKGAGGGGGAGGIGANGDGTTSGNGGVGITSGITGETHDYAGGGGGFGGGGIAFGHGASGGGDGGDAVEGSAATSPGSGGGGATTNKRGGRGADGIVIVRYRRP